MHYCVTEVWSTALQPWVNLRAIIDCLDVSVYVNVQVVLTASNANVGGPATAAAMAASRGWPQMVRPAMLTGSLGYAVGTAIGCAVSQWLRVL